MKKKNEPSWSIKMLGGFKSRWSFFFEQKDKNQFEKKKNEKILRFLQFDDDEDIRLHIIIDNCNSKIERENAQKKNTIYLLQ